MEYNLALPAVKTNCYRKSFACTGAKFWNALRDELKCKRSFGAIRDRLVDSLNLSIECLHCYLSEHSYNVYSQGRVVNIL